MNLTAATLTIGTAMTLFLQWVPWGRIPLIVPPSINIYNFTKL